MKRTERAAAKGSSKRGSRKSAAPKAKALTAGASPVATSAPHTGALEIASALKAAAYSLNEVAAALVAQGVYTDLKALELGTVLISPTVFPATARYQMSAALQATAKFSQADIEAALASLFPVRGPIKDGAIIDFKFLGVPGVEGGLWLTGRFSDGYVSLNPNVSGGVSAIWKVKALGDNLYAFECVGGGVGTTLRWLDGRTGDGTIGLAPEISERYSGTRWEVVNQTEKTYWLKCRGNSVSSQHVWLGSGKGGYGNVGLAPTPTGGLNVEAVGHVYYQVYITGVGWTPEASDWWWLGDLDAARQIEAVKIRIPGRKVTYEAHVSDVGWMPAVSDGALAGTTGEGRRLESLRIKVDRGHVFYEAYVERHNWMGEKSDGAEAGTTGRSLKMKAFRIRTEDTYAFPGGWACTATPWEAVIS